MELLQSQLNISIKLPNFLEINNLRQKLGILKIDALFDECCLKRKGKSFHLNIKNIAKSADFLQVKNICQRRNTIKTNRNEYLFSLAL